MKCNVSSILGLKPFGEDRFFLPVCYSPMFLCWLTWLFPWGESGPFISLLHFPLPVATLVASVHEVYPISFRSLSKVLFQVFCCYYNYMPSNVIKLRFTQRQFNKHGFYGFRKRIWIPCPSRYLAQSISSTCISFKLDINVNQTETMSRWTRCQGQILEITILGTGGGICFSRDCYSFCENMNDRVPWKWSGCVL